MAEADPNPCSSNPEPSSCPSPDLIMKNLIENRSAGEDAMAKLIFSYGDALERLTSHWMAARLRADQYEAYVCTSEWRIKHKGKSYKATHSFIEIVGVPNSEELTEKIIVDIHFKPQFNTMKSSKRYKLLHSCLPSIFVGTEEKLKEIIEYFCRLALPSRNVKDMMVYMQNKWLKPDRKTFPRRA